MLSLQKGEQRIQRVEARCLTSATEEVGSRLGHPWLENTASTGIRPFEAHVFFRTPLMSLRRLRLEKTPPVWKHADTFRKEGLVP